MNELMAFAKKLTENGFRVFYHPDMPTYLFAVIDGHVGYVQRALRGDYAYSTVHVPNVDTGSGFRYTNDLLYVTVMRDCCHCMVPVWWRGSTETVKPWKFEKWRKVHSTLVELS